MQLKSEKLKTLLVTFFVMLLWGSLFPSVKIGYSAFKINTQSTASILMFAGVRFAICGAIIWVIAAFRREKLKDISLTNITPILVMGLFSVVLHYAFTYIGLSLTDSSKTAILKQLGSLIYVCFSFLIFKDEKFSISKIIAALIGFLGIIAINFNTGSFSLLPGDILIILASLCTVAANVVGKKALHSNPAVLVVGISQLFGGLVLIIAAYLMGAQLPEFTQKAFFVFSYICIASIVSYCLWFTSVKNGNLSNLFIIKFSEPVFACVFGAILLNENIFKIQYLVAFILISSGITLANLKER